MYQKKTRGWSQHLDFMAWDILALEVALVLSFLLCGGFRSAENRGMFWGLFIFLPFLNLAIMMAMDAYHSVIRRDTYQEASKLMHQSTYLALSLGAFLILTQASTAIARFVFFMTLLLYIVLCFTIRVTWKSHLQHRLHIKNRAGLLIAAETGRMQEVIGHLASHNYRSYRFLGVAVLDEGVSTREAEERLSHIMAEGGDIAGLQVVADRSSLIDYLVRNWVDEVYLDVPGGRDMPIELIDKIMSMGITIHLAINDMDRIVARHKDIEWICGKATITTSLGYVSGRDLFLKRLMDMAGGAVGCLATGLLTLVLGPMIYLSSPGPIFFHQTRIGENGRKFEMYKFRSMYPDAEKRKQALVETQGDSGLMFKMEHDPRIIGMKQRKDGTWKKGVGGWMRDLSLDEFPQFFNVLKGEMSLVGTRPPTVDEWAQYKPTYRARMSTKPGLTGMWQVSGRSKIKDFEKVVQLDREYIENWSLKLDFQILVRTVAVVLTRRGAM